MLLDACVNPHIPKLRNPTSYRLIPNQKRLQQHRYWRLVRLPAGPSFPGRWLHFYLRAGIAQKCFPSIFAYISFIKLSGFVFSSYHLYLVKIFAAQTDSSRDARG
jgi:hypothetical protein